MISGFYNGSNDIFFLLAHYTVQLVVRYHCFRTTYQSLRYPWRWDWDIVLECLVSNYQCMLRKIPKYQRFQNIKHRNSKSHETLANVYICIFLKIQDCEGRALYMQSCLIFG